jgi:aspartyl-tRNA(Asn)/glutamyl-tRNA(Gln) amidotransferase subunit B
MARLERPNGHERPSVPQVTPLTRAPSPTGGCFRLPGLVSGFGHTLASQRCPGCYTEVMTEYEAVIGLEVHAQLRTRSKMYCTCPADYQQAPPNSKVCPVCLGLPGTLPVINRQAVESVIMTGLALHSTVSEHSKFDRKNYPYPDLMKGDQISQYDLPICVGGHLDIEVNGQERRIGITRVHLEEDVAKLLHRADPAGGEPYSLVDVNRSGVPLMELVSEPDMRSPEQARQYLMKLRTILQYLRVSTGSMEEGSFRCDANVSIRPLGSTDLFNRVEVKNMNSFRAVYRALEFEVGRQTRMAEQGERLEQETRGWSEERGETFSMRSKEHANDYRYFPEPDLPPLVIERAWVREVAQRLPELPDAKKGRFLASYGLSEYDASTLTATQAMATYFEETLRELSALPGASEESDGVMAKTVANWTITELHRLLNAANTDVEGSPLRPRALAGLLELMRRGTIGTVQAKTAFEAMFRTGKEAEAVVEELGLAQLTDVGPIGQAVGQAIEENPKAVQDFLGGKDTAVKFLVGQVMRTTRGKADPSVVADLMRDQLGVLQT